MKQEHPHVGAAYAIMRQKDNAFAIHVSVPGAPPATVTSFATAAAAERWIERHKGEVAKGAPQRRSYTMRRR